MTTRLLALTTLALAAVACGAPPALPGASTDFVVDDPALADEVRAAAAQWAGAGLEIADYVTVNAVAPDNGVVVAMAARSTLPALCNAKGSAPAGATVRMPEGCSKHEGGRFVALYLAAEVSPARRATIIAHEMAHILVPAAEHLDQRAGAIGILTSNGNSSTPTADDMAELARHTTVTVPE